MKHAEHQIHTVTIGGVYLACDVLMARVTIYLSDAIEARARKAAKARGTTIGRWITGQVTEKLENCWSPEVFAAIARAPFALR